MQQDARDWAWLISGVDPILRDCRLGTSPHAEVAQLMAKLDGRSWFLFGKYGVGKSGLAAGYLWDWIQRDKGSALFITAPEIFRAIRSTYGPNAGRDEFEVISAFVEYPLLVLDDLGAERITEDTPGRPGNRQWVEDNLMAVIGRRHATRATTIMTSNLDIGQIKARIGERLAWRIIEMCGKDHMREIVGANLRATDG